MHTTETLTVYKLDETGREVWRYAARVIQRGDHSVHLEASFDRELVDLGLVVFRRGDRFVETFYDDRWYNAFAVYDRDSGKLKGWYCNVCRPAEIGEESVRCADLALDVWVGASGECLVMDEDEFAALAIDEGERRKAREALQKILQLAEDGQLPT